jgi:hypothetical protein
MPVKVITRCVIGALLYASQVVAASKITTEQVRQVMEATDVAAEHRDTQAIGTYLGRNFFKYIDATEGEKEATVRIDREQYLKMIERGWQRVQNYGYQRKDVVINVTPDGSAAESFSTVVETFTVDGKDLVSKVREYATYELEDGRTVIVNIDGQPLVGDTTPQ